MKNIKDGTMNGEIKAVLIDIDNTLLSFDEYAKSTICSGFQFYNLGEYDDSVFLVFNRINSGLWEQLEKGELSFEELIKIRFNLIFRELGINFDGEEFERYFRKKLNDSAIPVPGALELLEYLKGKYIVCAASNGPLRQQTQRINISGMLPYFNHLFISEEIGFTKPSAEYFQICMDRINADLPPEQKLLPYECIMIGDSLTSDIAGGLGFGMKTCYFNIYRKDPLKNPDVTYEVFSLSEIMHIL